MGKRVLILTNNDIGLYSFRRELIEQLVEEQNEVFCSLPFGEKTEPLSEIGCRCIDTEISRHGKNPFEDIKLFFFYLKQIKRIKPDVILTYTIKPNVYGGLAASIKKVPYIANVTGLGTAIENGGIMQKFTIVLYRIGLRKAKTVFFQNESNLDFMKSKKVVKGNAELLPGSGVNLKQHYYEPYPENDNPTVFLTIGRIMKDKGIDEILEAAAVIKSEYPNVCFKLVGFYDDDYEKVISSAAESGLVEFIEQQPDIHPLLKESHATLHASYHEGMSNVLLETAATGRPIIATDVPGCREAYDNGVSGIAFRSHSAEDLVRAIKEFLALPYEERANMGKAGRAKMEKEFDRNIIVNKYMKII